MKRNRLKELAKDKRHIPGIYNYCDRWCERCPQTARCLNYSISQEESSDPESKDIRNEAFWKKISDLFQESMELLEEAGKERGTDLNSIDLAEEETNAAKDDAAKNHVVYRAAEGYAKMVEDWFKGKEELFFFPTVELGDGSVKIEEAVEVIRWYEFFIAAKVMRAIRGSMEEDREELAAHDSDGSAKIALIAIDRSIAAWGVIPRHNRFYQESVLKIISLLTLLRQAVEDTFPGAKSFIRPGLDQDEPHRS